MSETYGVTFDIVREEPEAGTPEISDASRNVLNIMKLGAIFGFPYLKDPRTEGTHWLTMSGTKESLLFFLEDIGKYPSNVTVMYVLDTEDGPEPKDTLSANSFESLKETIGDWIAKCRIQFYSPE